MKKRFMSLTLATLMVFSMLITTAFAASGTSTQSPSSNLGLALDPGASGWSQVVNVRFSTVPSDAVVDTITIVPGTPTINSGNKNFLGAVLPSLLKITAPDGTTATISWSNKMTTTAFKGVDARGTWTLQMYGTNLTKPTGDYMIVLLRFGNVIYKSLDMTISYN